MATPKKRGNKFRVRVYTGTDKEGKKIYRSVTANTKREAERLAAEIRIDYEYREDLTFGDAVQRYIDSKSNVLSPSTLRGYVGIRRNYVELIKDIRLSRITNEDLQRQINEIAKDHSPKTVANVRGLISSVMKMFVPTFHVDIKVPPKIKREKRIPTDEEVRKLLEVASIEQRPDEFPIILAAFGSLRRGEISALYPDSIYDDHITIRRDYVLDEHEKWVLKDRPKSDAGYRDVPLPKEVIDRLQALVKGQKPGKDAFGIIGITPNMIYEYFRGTMKKAGLSGFDFHSLRHYFATMMHEHGIPDKTIAKIGGWEDISTLQKIYQHSTKTAEEAAAETIREQFEKIAG